MSFDFASLKAQVRRTVHDTMSIPAYYSDREMVREEEVRVRFHTKINRFGDVLDQGWAEVVEGVNRLIFNRDELVEKGIILINGGRVQLAPPGFEGVALVLHVQEPDSGPVEVVWQVSQE